MHPQPHLNLYYLEIYGHVHPSVIFKQHKYEAIDIARAQGHIAIVDVLLKNAAYYNQAANNVPVSWTLASTCNKALLTAPTHPLLPQRPLHTPKQTAHSVALLKAVEEGQRETVVKLMKKGANVNYQNEVRST